MPTVEFSVGLKGDEIQCRIVRDEGMIVVPHTPEEARKIGWAFLEAAELSDQRIRRAAAGRLRVPWEAPAMAMLGTVCEELTALHDKIDGLAHNSAVDASPVPEPEPHMAATKTRKTAAQKKAEKPPVARGKARAEPASGGTATMTMTKPKAAAKKAAPAAKKGKKGC